MLCTVKWGKKSHAVESLTWPLNSYNCSENYPKNKIKNKNKDKVEIRLGNTNPELSNINVPLIIYGLYTAAVWAETHPEEQLVVVQPLYGQLQVLVYPFIVADLLAVLLESKKR